MKSFVSTKIKELKASPTLEISGLAAKLKNEGHDVIGLSVGETDWKAPEVFIENEYGALKEGHTRYTPVPGLLSARKSILDWMKDSYSFLSDYNSNQIILNPGAKFSIFACLSAVCDEKDKVAYFAPYWVSYPAMCDLLGLKKKPINGVTFEDKLSELSKILKEGIRLIILNSPNNPSGEVLNLIEMKQLGELLSQYPDVFIVSDDIYSHVYFNGKRAPHLLDTHPSLSERTVCINGASKNFALTGLRLGWTVGPLEVIKAMGKIQGQTTSCVHAATQVAFSKSLSSVKGPTEIQLNGLISKNKTAIDKLKTIKGLSIGALPEGAFYLWVSIQELIESKKISSSLEFSKRLLEDKKVAVVPGEAFGQEGYFRLTYSLDLKIVLEGLDRIEKFISNL